MRLSELLSIKIRDASRDVEISNISMDTREENQNGAFFCIKGLTYDAHEYIDKAIQQGAVAIIYQYEIKIDPSQHPDIIFIKCEDTRLEFAKAAEVFYGRPSSKLRTYAVTGTNGKTTTSYLMYSVLKLFEKAAYNGTAGTIIGGRPSPYRHLTTPDTKDLIQIFKSALDEGCKSIAFELSSHALDMKRAAGVGLDVAIYTNLSRDHLDYHKTMDNYLKAKAEIFKLLKPEGLALINADDAYAEEVIAFAERAGLKKIKTYGKKEGCDYRICNIELSPSSTVFQLVIEGRSYTLKSNLISEINCYNLAAAVAALHETGFSMEDILPKLLSIDFNIGRFQFVKSSKYSIIVDFSHTPDGFEKVFEFTDALRGKDRDKKVISVFGSAGKRDKGKRPEMGRIAAKHSDYIVLTEDDNRDESPRDISLEIAEGIKAYCEYSVIDDREEAIKHALEYASEGDIVVLLGKGVEDFIYRDDRSDPWPGDHVIAAKYAEI